jgi:EAL domain-containing protein (putative c-di-GMP-specific phosphodiesterase class I)
VRLIRARQGAVERLFWSRDSRLVMRLAEHLPEARVIELADSGWCVIASAEELTEDLVASMADGTACGLADVDPSQPPAERYVVALGYAVQISGLGDRIGMGETPEVASRKVLALFFACHEHHVEFQPIVDMQTMRAHEWECLFRLSPGMGTETISSVVEAAVVARRPVDFDTFVVDATLARIAQVAEAGSAGRRIRFSVNLLPTSLLAPTFEAEVFAERVRGAGLLPRQIVVECTEQQAIHDIPRLKKQVKALRRLGFGFAVDDAGAGYASFTVIAALEPSIIKIDREIVSGIGNKDADAKKALVEAFVSFSHRIGAQIVAEGIENRRDLLALQDREVDFGQGYLLGRSAATPQQPRRIRDIDDVTRVISSAGGWDGAVSSRVASRQ